MMSFSRKQRGQNISKLEMTTIFTCKMLLHILYTNYSIETYAFRSNRNHDVRESESLSNDKEDAKWDYFRECSMLHVFHSLFHKVWESGKLSGGLNGRIHELFFYAHQQLLRRLEKSSNE